MSEPWRKAETTLIFNLKGKTVVIGSMGKSFAPLPCHLTSVTVGETGVSVHVRIILTKGIPLIHYFMNSMCS